VSLPYQVIFRGKPACPCLVRWLTVYESVLLRLGLIKHNIDIYQLIGGAAASAGTHTKGGAYDLAQVSTEQIRIAREMGAAAWHRPLNWDGRGGIEHHHGVLNGCPHNAPAAYQISDYIAGRNGLANRAVDTGPRVLPLRTWEQGIAWATERAAAKRPADVEAAIAAVRKAKQGAKSKPVRLQRIKQALASLKKVKKS
jgi:hypothetical protein